MLNLKKGTHMFENYKVIDLSHSLTSDIPTWTGSCGFSLDVKRDYDRVFCVQQIKMHAGAGTHIDAPSHRFENGLCVGDIALENLLVPGYVIDVSKKAHADYEISKEDIEEYEALYGKIPSHSLVIGYTGWDKYWSCPDKYRNLDEKGQMHFPAFSKDAAEFLLERNVAGLAIDTLSPDCLDLDFPVHKLFLGQGKYLIENITNLGSLPPSGAFIIALPIKAQFGTESPLRIIALLQK